MIQLCVYNLKSTDIYRKQKYILDIDIETMYEYIQNKYPDNWITKTQYMEYIHIIGNVVVRYFTYAPIDLEELDAIIALEKRL